MTRRDFVMISDVLRSCQPTRTNRTAYAMWEVIVEDFARKLVGTNPNFDAARFKRACGMEA